MGKVRALLSKGSEKLGESLFGWSIPAIQACPGRSSVCSRVCYATHGRFVTRTVKEWLRWRYEQSMRPGFVAAMCDEIFRRSVLVLRVHISGDFYGPKYTSRWIEIAARNPRVRFFAYTRSWRVAKLEPLVRAFGALPNVRLWYSCDRETGLPPSVPEGVRVAWLQDTEERPQGGDLVFQVHRLRRLALPVVVPVCEQELKTARARGVTCGNCRICWE